MQFNQLAQQIHQTHQALQQSAAKAINLHLTLRNWLIGFYIVEFEQKGEDRAAYGERLLVELSKAISIKGLSKTALKLNRQFYLAYPQIGQTASDFLGKMNVKGILSFGQTLSDLLLPIHNHLIENRQTVSAQTSTLQVPPEKLISRLSFSHLVELFEVTNPLYRTFYEFPAQKATGRYGNFGGRYIACMPSEAA